MTYNDARKRVRNRLRKYSVVDITTSVVSVISSPTNSAAAQFQKLPWLYLHILQIALEDTMTPIGNWTFNRPENFAKITYDLKKSVFELWNFPEEHCSENSIILRVVRSLPVQITFQQGLSYDSMAWIASLTELKIENKSVKFFTKAINVSPTEYLKSMFAITSSTFASKARIIDANSFMALGEKQFDLCTKVLNEISTGFEKLRIELRGLISKQSNYQKAELDQIPLLAEFPLIKISQRHYLVLDQTCLELSIEEWLYKTLAYQNSNEFSNIFSQEFERSVINDVISHRADFLPEKELSCKYPSLVKVVDGLLIGKYFNLLIEVKFTGKRRHNRAASADQYFQHFEDVKKAVIQGVSFCQNAKLDIKPTYQFIITNRRRWVGSLEHIRQLMGVDSWARACQEKINLTVDFIPQLPPSHVLILTWAELENFLILSRASESSCVELLENASNKSKQFWPDWIFFEQLLKPYAAKIQITQSHRRKRMESLIDTFLPHPGSSNEA